MKVRATKKNGLPIRGERSLGARVEIVDMLAYGEEFEATEEYGGWLYIEGKGWCDASYTEPVKFNAGGGASSWNDLTDRPFEGETVQQVIYDGKIETYEIEEGFPAGTPFDAIDFIAGETYKIWFNGEEYELVAWQVDKYQDYEIVAIGSKSMYQDEVVSDTEPPFAISVNRLYEDYRVVETEGYFMSATAGAYDLVVTIAHKGLAENNAPLSYFESAVKGARYSPVVEWDGDTSDRDSFSFNGATYVKVSDTVLSSDAINTSSYESTFSDEQYPHYVSHMWASSDDKVIFSSSVMFCMESGSFELFMGNGTSAGTVDVPSAGTYFQFNDRRGNYANGLYKREGGECLTGIVLSTGATNQDKWLLTVDESGEIVTTLISGRVSNTGGR